MHLLGRPRKRSMRRGAIVALFAILIAVQFWLAPSPTSAIGEASVEGASFADLVAGKTNPVYEVRFTTSSRSLAQNITISFPAARPRLPRRTRS